MVNGEVLKYGKRVMLSHWKGDQEEFINYLIRAGVLDVNKIRIAVVKHFYYAQCEGCQKMQAITNTAEEFNVSEKTIENIIYNSFYQPIGF